MCTQGQHHENIQLRPSVWGAVKSIYPIEEAIEVKRIIGESLIEESCDLRSETITLLEILDQIKQEHNTAVIGSINKCSSLADPPGVRERIVKQILLLAEYIRQKPDCQQSPPIQCEAVKYAAKFNENKQIERNLQVPLISEELEHMRRCSPLMQTDGIEEIDSIVKGLRKELTDECLELKREIEIIQVSISEAMNNSFSRTPTVKELLVATNELEKQALHKSASRTHSNRTARCPPTLPPVYRPTRRRASQISPLH